MKEKFNEYLMNGLSDYDKEYLPTYQYVMLLSKNDEIKAYFANMDYRYFIEYPKSDLEYNNPREVLETEMKLSNSDAGIMYENVNGQLQVIAFIDLCV